HKYRCRVPRGSIQSEEFERIARRGRRVRRGQEERVTMYRRWSAATLAVGVLISGRVAFAQMDLSGQWANRLHEDQPWRGPGQEMGEFTALQLTAEARAKAESWTASVYTIPERQCIPFAADMGYTIGNLRICGAKDIYSQG